MSRAWLISDGSSVVFMWVPGHVGLAGNSAAKLRTSCIRLNQLRVNVINMLRLPHQDEIIIHRLRIGHSYFTHGHLLRGETPLRYLAYQVDFTVEHVLLHCVSFTNAREHFFCVTLTSMSELFSKVASRSIIDFIKETGFYHKI